MMMMRGVVLVFDISYLYFRIQILQEFYKIKSVKNMQENVRKYRFCFNKIKTITLIVFEIFGDIQYAVALAEALCFILPCLNTYSRAAFLIYRNVEE